MKKFYPIISFFIALYLFPQFKGFSQTGNISFTLTNISEYDNFLCEKSYFQLVKHKEKGFSYLDYTINTEEGETILKDSVIYQFQAYNIKSDLPKTYYSFNSKIEINIDNIIPDKYIIAIQNIPNRTAGFIVDKRNKKVIIDLTKKNANSLITLENTFVFIDLNMKLVKME